MKDLSGGGTSSPGTGILCWRNATVVVQNSLVAYATGSALRARQGGQLNVENCLLANSGIGIQATDSGTVVRVSDTMTAANTTGWNNASASTFESYGNNRTRGNTTDIGGTGTISVVAQN